MKKLTIQEHVISVGNKSFYQCDSLSTVICKATTPPQFVQEPSFPYELATLYVPSQSLEDYMSHNGWQQFHQIYGVKFTIPGDVNGDGEVTIADANTVIIIINGGSSSGHTRVPDPDGDGWTILGDVNGDGEINIADINAVINEILKN